MEQQKRKIALADAIIQAMLVKGLITREERKKIEKHCHEGICKINDALGSRK